MIRHSHPGHLKKIYLYFSVVTIAFLTLFTSNNLQAKEASQEETSKIIFLGDSITAGYGVAKSRAYPALLAAKLKEEKLNSYKVINGGISGSTTASGLSRLKWQLKGKPRFIIIALGANDGLRGTQVDKTKENLEEIIELAKSHQLKILLAGMMMPPNYGKHYTKEFAAIFPDLAEKHKISLMPFLLDGVAGEAKLNQSDGIHPNEAGHKVIAEKMWPHLKKLLH
ncbi:MAG: arylesterase [Oligoflexales bacterium]|nr:arylesterase [Oligoflexales bacterium]